LIQLKKMKATKKTAAKHQPPAAGLRHLRLNRQVMLDAILSARQFRAASRHRDTALEDLSIEPI
jgi:hypothetical protein